MIFSVLNQKGGVGKTTLTLNLAAALLELKPDRTLALFDLDDQESLFRYRRIAKGKDGDKSFKNAGFFSVPLADLPNQIEEIRSGFDHILMDAPRSLDDELTAALFSLCDGALIPMQPEYDSLLAAKRTMDVAEKIGLKKMARGKPNLRARVVISHNSNSGHRIQVKNAARELFEEKLCRTLIPNASVVGLAAFNSQSVLFNSPKSPAAHAFRRLAQELERSWWL
jgi:chromosome partitioning protein